MSFEIIALAIMIFSFLGMVAIIGRRVPSIITLPNNPNLIPINDLKERMTREGKDLLKKNYFQIQLFVQKGLYRIRIVILRLDNKIFNLNLRLKEKSKKTKEDIDFELDDIKNKLKNK